MQLTMKESVARLWTGDAWHDRLYFAQVREDPLLEIEALRPAPGETIVVVSSGGCTALSLLAAGAGRLFAVDSNVTQNYLLELKALAVARLPHRQALCFLGGGLCRERDRWEIYSRLKALLSHAARAYWNARPRSVRRGVIASGVTERFLAWIVCVIRLAIHPTARIARLLACRTIDEQREFYAKQWNTQRWRGLFSLLVNRRVMQRAYDTSFFRHVDNSDFSRHFYRLAEYALTNLPVQNNYFLHQMLTGSYPIGAGGGLPPYLNEAGASVISGALDRLTIVNGTYQSFLRACPGASINGFALSNVCEWLSLDEIDSLFGEIARTAAPGARVCFRNFVGWTEVPVRWRDTIVEDRNRGAALIRTDRSMTQSRFAVCTVR